MKARLLSVAVGCAFATLLACGQAVAATAPDMTWHGGPVMHGAAVHAIYWAPPGHPLPAGYTSLADAFWHDLAVDSGASSNVLSTLPQYHDASGPASYAVRYAGGLLDTQAYPPGGCSNYSQRDGSPLSTCVTDSQIGDEVSRLVTAGGLPKGLGDVYVVFLPAGIGTCLDGSGGSCSNRDYCANHDFSSSDPSSAIVYAAIPYPEFGCGAPSSPSANPADLAVDNASHELAEAMTDPMFNGWYDNQGQENGDKCLVWFSPSLGTAPGGTFNQAIGQGVYELQSEWSNLHHACVGAFATFGFGVAGRSVSFDAGASAGPGGPIAGYSWSFDDGGAASGTSVTHRFTHPGSYRVTLTVRGQAGSVSASRTVIVAPLQPTVQINGQSRRSALARGIAMRLGGEGAATLRLLLLPTRRSQPPTLLATLQVTLDAGRVKAVQLRLSRTARRRLASGSVARIQAELVETVGTLRVGPARAVGQLR